ncbi:Mannose-6-phosphate isomerase [uncultured archaeon]|nr:Mannose-6-phosphate isomerase [uncultured archaeon]
MKEVKRPWGDFKQFVFNEKCTVKILEVSPNSMLSLQKHKKRKEMWYFLTSGFAEVGNKKNRIKKGETVIINKNVSHRLYAKNKSVKVLEISFGTFDENDEIRLEDKYGRK